MADGPRTAAALSLPTRDRRRSLSLFWGVLFLAAVWGSAHLTEVHPLLLFQAEAIANVARFLQGMFPPNLSPAFLLTLLRPTLETIQISIAGTTLAVLIGFPLGLLATATLTYRGVLHEMGAPSPLLRLLRVLPYAGARGLLSLFRSIPEFVWAFLFVRAVGLGPFPGVLALGVAYGGMLGKVYSEILESMDPRPVEALQSTGGSRLSLALYGLLPQAFPHFLSYTLYRWECAIRASAIFGFVGAGGIGQEIELSMRMFNFAEVATELGVLFVLVVGVDYLSARIRRAWS